MNKHVPRNVPITLHCIEKFILSLPINKTTIKSKKLMHKDSDIRRHRTEGRCSGC